VALGMIAYKFLDAGAVSPFARVRWSVDEWMEAGRVELCRSGIHACRVGDLPLWLRHELWEIELDGEIVERQRQVIAARARLTRRIDAWNDALAQEFGRFCARRTRERVGFLPELGGYVADVERFVAERRIPIAGFAAARAAERRDGPAGYAEERAFQAAWLADRLGLN
jgi:hypothetical protein